MGIRLGGVTPIQTFPKLCKAPNPYIGDYSLYIQSPDSGLGQTTWVDGPVLNTSQSFNATFQFRPEWGDDGLNRIRVGISSNDTGSEGENAFIIFQNGSDAVQEDSVTYLGTYVQDTPSGDSIADDFHGEWVNVRLQGTGTGEVRAKVWEVGTSEPESWQLTRNFTGATGDFGINVGGDVVRNAYLDELTIQGQAIEEPAVNQTTDDEGIILETQSVIVPNESADYRVKLIQEGDDGMNESIDVTDDAGTTVASNNTSVLTVDEANNELVAVNDTNVSQVVLVTASNGDLQTSKEVVVATKTVDNLEILPSIYRTEAIFADSTIFFLIIATLIGVAATRFATSFAGIAVYEVSIVIGWFGGYVGLGITLLSLFAALFIGLNLAENTQITSVRRGGRF